MKNSRGIVGLVVFVLSLWAVVVVTYAKQVSEKGAKLDRLIPLQQSSCSSSSSGVGPQV